MISKIHLFFQDERQGDEGGFSITEHKRGDNEHQSDAEVSTLPNEIPNEEPQRLSPQRTQNSKELRSNKDAKPQTPSKSIPNNVVTSLSAWKKKYPETKATESITTQNQAKKLVVLNGLILCLKTSFNVTFKVCTLFERVLIFIERFLWHFLLFARTNEQKEPPRKSARLRNMSTCSVASNASVGCSVKKVPKIKQHLTLTVPSTPSFMRYCNPKVC